MKLRIFDLRDNSLGVSDKLSKVCAQILVSAVSVGIPPFAKLAKDEALTHVEHWSLHKAELAEVSDAAMDAALLPLLKA